MNFYRAAKEMKNFLSINIIVSWVLIFGFISAKQLNAGPVNIFEAEDFLREFDLGGMGKDDPGSKPGRQENYPLTKPPSDSLSSGTPAMADLKLSAVNNPGDHEFNGAYIEQQAGNDSQAINVFLLKWINAWQNTAGPKGDIEQYLSFYSDFFNSTNLDKNAWIIDKKKKNNNKTWIQVTLENIEIGAPDAEGQVEIRCRQDYKSSNYSEQSRKLLVLTKEQGKWKILAEKTLLSE